MERDTAEKFRTIFYKYHPQVIVNTAVPGWPDRMLQCPGSVVVFVELKFIPIPKSGIFRIPLRQEQAVWLAKWTYNGGKCFLFLGLNDKFGIVCSPSWKYWLRVPKNTYSFYDFPLLFANNDDIIKWFEYWLK